MKNQQIKTYEEGVDATTMQRIKEFYARQQRQLRRAKKRIETHSRFTINSPREVARRLRQIAAGQLQVSPAT